MRRIEKISPESDLHDRGRRNQEGQERNAVRAIKRVGQSPLIHADDR